MRELKEALADQEEEIRTAAVRALDESQLSFARQQHEYPVYQRLTDLLSGRESRLDGQYRRTVIRALARWYNEGRPEEKDETETEDEESTHETERPDPRARAEHGALQKELERLRDTEPRLWLRAAACEVWVTAYRLRKGE
jgi:hypothetical protein